MEPKKIYPKSKEDLFSLDVMGSFFARQYFVPGFKTVELIKITPTKTMTKNWVIAYELRPVENKIAASARVWGKTMQKNTYALLKFISQTEAGKYLPRYFEYLDSLKMGFYLDIGGKPIDILQKNFTFWQKHAGQIGILIAVLQNLKIPSELLKTHREKDEKKFISDSLRKINKYSADKGLYFGSLADLYLNELADKCFSEDEFTFNHFDAHQNHIYFDESSNSLRVLDLDLAKRFHPATDPANFLAHAYVMLRHHFTEKKVIEVIELFLAGYISESGTLKEKFGQCLDILKTRAIIQIAQMTANVFGKPNEGSRKVFALLKELQQVNLAALVLGH